MPNADPQDVLNPRADELVAYIMQTTDGLRFCMPYGEEFLTSVIELLHERDVLAREITQGEQNSVYLCELPEHARAALRQLHATGTT